jgi:formylglycine-generating enzyme required for sulfatase activity
MGRDFERAIRRRRRLASFCAIGLCVALSPAAYAQSSVGAPVPIPGTALPPAFVPVPGAFRDCDTCTEMVPIPRGEVTVGSSPDTVDRSAGEGPRRRVRIDYDLAVARTEVTRAQWLEFVAATKHPTEPGCQYYDGHYGYVMEHDWRRPGFAQRAEHPVVCVSVRDAEAFTVWLSARTGRAYRLPSSAEYEYFNRAGSDAPWFWGTASASACEYANVGDLGAKPFYPKQAVHNCSDDYLHTAPVGRFKPNAFGLYDTVGNVFEWTSDCWHATFDGAPADGSAWLEANGGDCRYRTPRGGSWVSGLNWTRAAAQSKDPYDYRSFLLGFRVVTTQLGAGQVGAGQLGAAQPTPKDRPRRR